LEQIPSTLLYKSVSILTKLTEIKAKPLVDLIAMAKLLSLFLILAFAIAMSIEDTQAACDDNLPALIMECQQYVMPPKKPLIPPSNSCCSAVQKADIPCLCSKVTKKIEEIVSMEKVVYVSKKCGIEVKSGFKCGSKCFMWIFT
jgi:hypothetical protein